MLRVPFLDLPKQVESIRSEVDAEIQKILQRCDFVGGQAVEEFEKAFAEYCGCKYCVGVSNGTDAIYLALRALGIGPGDEVITVPNTFIGTTAPVTRAGAALKFVDVNPETLNIDVARIESAITTKTRAILPVHLFGQPADMRPILDIARRHDLLVIEDAAQAHGARYRGQRVGSLGQAACFSFYPGKNLGAFGDAGAVVTQQPEVAEKIRILRDAGRTSKYEHVLEGFNHRLDTLQAAVLKIKLKYLDEWNAKRRKVATLYQGYFSKHEKIRTVTEPDGLEGVYHLFVIQVEDRDRVRKALQERGISTGIHYPICLHLQPAYQYLGYPHGAFPVAEKAAAKLLSLPIFPEMSEDMVEYVANQVIQAV